MLESPATDPGRSAEETIRAEIIAALNAAFRGFSFPGGRWSTGYGAEMAADALLSGPLAPILQEAAQLRARLHEVEKGREGSGRDPGGSGSQAPPEAPSDLRPAGVDPSRWELSEETRAFIREIDLATVQPGDPRLSQTLIGPAGPAIGLDGYGSQARPLAPSYDPPRCTATGNPCGTDTVIAGRQCPDSRWGGRCAHHIAKRVAALGIEARRAETLGSACESPAPTGAMPDPLTPAPEATQEAGDGR